MVAIQRCGLVVSVGRASDHLFVVGVAPRDNDNADERRDSNRPSGQRLDLRHGDELLRDGDPEKRVERE